MLRGLPLVLILLVGTPVAWAEGPADQIGRPDPNAKLATADTARTKRNEALACSARRAAVQARTTQLAPGKIAETAWFACGDEWFDAMAEFASAGFAINGGGTGRDLSLEAFGKAGDLLRADWDRRAPAIISAARRAGPPL